MDALHVPEEGDPREEDRVFLCDLGPPGKIIEDTGLKGETVGGARVSSLHANFIVNLGGASSRDVLGLIGLVRRRVHDRIGVWLDCEVRYADETGKLVPASEACP